MAARGVKYVDCYGVDNALVSASFICKTSYGTYYHFNLSNNSLSLPKVRVADPTFLGYFIDKGVSAAAKVVRKVCEPIPGRLIS
jgi:UDP-N-acetylglucosamine/UDP-N-acetylgalactosamine diphosphorylase